LANHRRYHWYVADSAALLEADRDTGPLRVMIVDDHSVVRAGTRQVLETADDIVVVGEAGDGSSALALVDGLAPELVLMDIGLPGTNGIDVARQMIASHPRVRVVILSASDDDECVRRAIDLGLSGYLCKTMPRDELIGAVRAAGEGTTVFNHVSSARLPRGHSSSSAAAESRLTWREGQTVDLVAEGLSNRAIARRMGVSVRTIEGHLNHAFAKLGVQSRTELVRMVLTRRLAVDASSDEAAP
jgi:DNA-binding NarL/FixJ family response regulator